MPTNRNSLAARFLINFMIPILEKSRGKKRTLGDWFTGGLGMGLGVP
jgi:hypothetical protein